MTTENELLSKACGEVTPTEVLLLQVRVKQLRDSVAELEREHLAEHQAAVDMWTQRDEAREQRDAALARLKEIEDDRTRRAEIQDDGTTPSLDDVIREFDRGNFYHVNDMIHRDGISKFSYAYCRSVVKHCVELREALARVKSLEGVVREIHFMRSELGEIPGEPKPNAESVAMNMANLALKALDQGGG